MENFDKEQNLVLWNIADSVCKFQTKYWSRNENYRTAPIFNNAFFFKEEPRTEAKGAGSGTDRNGSTAPRNKE